MESTSKNLFIVFVLCCFSFIYYVVSKNQNVRYIVKDKHTMETHIEFEKKDDAEQYVNHYREYHDYLIEERTTK